MDELQQAREKIDPIDREMAKRFVRRMRAVEQIAALQFFCFLFPSGARTNTLLPKRGHRYFTQLFLPNFTQTKEA